MTSTVEVLATLEWVRRQNFRPVPLRKRSKASMDEKYVDLNYSPPPDSLWTERDIGIGVVTGPKHGGPLDVDCDCPEAVFFSSKFLPTTTAVFGRESKRASHYLYRVEVDSVPKRSFVDPIARSTIVELRGDGGHQTVFPGSLHEDTGEIVSWEGPSPDVPRADAERLEFAVKKVAIATLISRHLWAEGQRNEVVKHVTGLLFYLEWPEEEVRSLISAVMEYTGDTDRTRLRTVISTFKKGENGGKITGSHTLRAFLGDDRIVDRILEWGGNDHLSFLQDYNERFAVVSVRGKFRIAETMTMERGGVPVLYAKDDFLNLMNTDCCEIDGKKIPKCKLWLAHPRRRSYRGVDFIPGEEDTSPVLNLWTGWAVDPREAQTASCRAWLDLLYYVICGADDSLYNWMLNWFANILREPKNRSMAAPVIIGKEGAGKSLLLAYFGKILGPGYVVVTNEEHIYGKFNSHLATALLLHSEEALYGGDKRHRGIIRSLITDEHLMFEKKGVDAEQIHRYFRLILTSNEIHAAPPAADDRRFTVIDMEYRRIEPPLVKEVVNELENGGPSSLFKYLTEDFTYDREVPRVNIKNEAIANLKAINFDPITSFWYETLRAGVILPDYMGWAQKPLGAEWPNQVSSSALHLAMRLHARDRGRNQVPETTQLSIALNRMVGLKLDRIQKYYANPMADDAPREVRLLPTKQYSIMNLPPLVECRKAFERYVGQRVDWPKDAEEADTPVHFRY